jgi:Uma2 family endonuclease
MSQVLQGRSTLFDLAQETDKAELIAGRIVRIMPTGRRPNRVAGRIFRSLDDFAQQTGQGEAYTDNMGFAVPMLPSGRESFSPDASYFEGPFTDDAMRFLQGPPTLAVEVRSEGDYGAAAEAELAAKPADYFQAGTLVVWDVDCEADTIYVYRANNPARPTTFGRGEMADALPALPGWSVSVDWVFDAHK